MVLSREAVMTPSGHVITPRTCIIARQIRPNPNRRYGNGNSSKHVRLPRARGAPRASEARLHPACCRQGVRDSAFKILWLRPETPLKRIDRLRQDRSMSSSTAKRTLRHSELVVGMRQGRDRFVPVNINQCRPAENLSEGRFDQTLSVFRCRRDRCALAAKSV